MVGLGCGFTPGSGGDGNPSIDAPAPTIDGDPSVNDAETIDATPAIDADETLCQTTCTMGSCVGGTCVITCDDSSPCTDVTCPPDVPCEVNCTSNNLPACTGTVTCAPDQPCVVTCSGSPDFAPGGPSHPGCNQVDCNGACSCDVSCQSGGFAGGGPGCSMPTTSCPQGCDNGDGCSATGPCDLCP
jgi:hypothetical protein